MSRKLRSEVIDLDLTDLYHTDSRCVRRAFLFTSDDDHRRKELENLVRFLQLIFAIDVLFVSFMENHFHIVLRVCRDEALSWSPLEVAWRWACLHPPRNKGNHYLPDHKVEPAVQAWAADPEWVEEHREKLYDISQFMKDAKQTVAEQANREDGVTGHFFQGRFDCNPIEDEAGLLAVGAYVDLNPFAAGLCEVPELGQFTSLRERVESRDQVLKHLRELAERDTEGAPPAVQRWLERDVWVAPVEGPPEGEPLPERDVESVRTREAKANPAPAASSCDEEDPPHPSRLARRMDRIGRWPFRLTRTIRPVFRTLQITLDEYLQFVDATARLLREGKAALDLTARPILDRLGTSPDGVAELILKLHEKTRHCDASLEVP